MLKRVVNRSQVDLISLLPKIYGCPMFLHGTEEIQAHFLARSQTQPPNSITRALMGAIAESEWFCSEQYLGG